MELLNTHNLFEVIEYDQQPRRTPVQAAARVNSCRAHLAELEKRREAWIEDGQNRLQELMTDNVPRMEAMREGREITRGIAIQESLIRQALPEAQPFYEQAGHLILSTVDVLIQ
jgi:hypothetical protein